MGSIVSKNAFMPPALNEFPDFDSETPSLHFIPTIKFHNYIPAYFYSQEGAKYTILYSHGNAEDIFRLKDLMVRLSKEFQINFLTFDYSGYSCSYVKSKGSPREVLSPDYFEFFQQEIQPNEHLSYDDIESAFNYLRNDLQIPAKKIIIMGRSLGTGPACHLAAKLTGEDRPAGLILQSPFLSAIRVVINTPFTLPIDIFPNLMNIKSVTVPILVIHGTEDKVINCSHSHTLITLPIKKLLSYQFIEDAGHNDIETRYFHQYKTTIDNFFITLENHDYNQTFEKKRILSFSVDTENY